MFSKFIFLSWLFCILLKNTKYMAVILSTTYWVASCSPTNFPPIKIDPAYTRVAQATGGQVFVVNPNETSLLFNLFKPTLKGNRDHLLFLQDTHSATAKTYTIPADSTITDMTFSITSDALSMAKVFRPSGAEVLPIDPSVTITRLPTAKIVEITKPEAGTWELSVSGTGQLSMSVSGTSSISFHDFNFVEERGRLGHTGLFPIVGEPIRSDTPAWATAFITGKIATANFELLALDNRLIRPIELHKGTGEVAIDEFFGAFTLPTEPFRVSVKGVDQAGKAFMRVYPKVFTAQTVKIVSETLWLKLNRQGPPKINFTVTNYGAVGQFTISATQMMGLAQTTPSAINLGTNQPT